MSSFRTDITHDWRAGLRVTGSRSLSTAELRRITQRRRLTMAKAFLWLAGSLTILIVCAAVIVVFPDPREPLLATTRLIVVSLACVLGVPLCFAMANDYFKRLGVLRRQSGDSTVLVCEGLVVDLVVPPRALEQLRRRLGEGSRVVLEVLMRSSLVWSVNGRLQESWVVAPTGRTVPPPDQARLAAQYVRPVETERGTFRLHQRLLSDRECAELQGYLPRLGLARLVFVLCLNAIAAGHLVGYIRKPVGLPLVGMLVVAAVVWCDTQLFRLLRTRRRMSRDLHEKFVVIYQADPAADASAETVTEFLPHSGAQWTIGGRAAAWRRLYAPTGS